MNHIRRLVGKKQRLKREQENYIKHGSGVLEELLALCDGNCRIPLRYFTAVEIERATQHSDKKIKVEGGYITVGSLNKRLVLIRFWESVYISNPGYMYRDIAISAQMSHLKNVLRLVGCCLEFERPVMVYEYVEAITLYELLFKKDYHDQTRKSLLSWGSRLRIAIDVASAVVFLHTEFPTPITHRDLKPSHVIIDQNSGVAKVMDFTFSISLPPGESQVEEDHVAGTIGYIDPEYMRSCIVTQKIDVYSFGVVLCQLLTGKANLLGSRIMDREHSDIVSIIEVNNIMDLVDPAILEEHGIGIEQQLEDYVDLCKKCTASKGEDRPYMIEVAKELRRIEKCFRVLTLGQN